LDRVRLVKPPPPDDVDGSVTANLTSTFYENR
jgi:hypothetical protein